MVFVREASAAIVLVALTLLSHCAGMATVIAWAKPSFTNDVHRLGTIRSAMLMMRFMTAFIGLHVFEILLGRGSIAGSVFHYGNLPFISRPPVALSAC